MRRTEHLRRAKHEQSRFEAGDSGTSDPLNAWRANLTWTGDELVFEAALDPNTPSISEVGGAMSNHRWSAGCLLPTGDQGRRYAVSLRTSLRCPRAGIHTRYSQVLNQMRESRRNPRTLSALPARDGQGDWRSRRRGGRASVVVRGRESRPHGEGKQWMQFDSRRQS